METLSFTDVAKLINHIGHTTLSATPSEESKDRWSIYEGSVQTGGLILRFSVLYLHADATVDHLKQASAKHAALKNSEVRQVQVVYAPSLVEKIPRFKSEFAESLAKNALSSNEFLISHFRQPLERYINTIGALSHPHYVEPSFDAPSRYKRGTRNPVYTFLAGKRRAIEQQRGDMGVILAEPGQGKTFLTKYLAASLVKSGVLPIYVHSDQWLRMHPDDLSSLSKTIAYSFRYFESPIGWIEGYEEEFLLVCLKAGIFQVIFDGLDEYVLRNQGKVDASDIVDALLNLSQRTGAGIVVTSRTSFWDSEFADMAATEGADEQALAVFRIQPFDSNHAKTYFESSFNYSEPNVTTSIQLFEHLKQKTSGAGIDLIGRGFFLYLIADLVARGYSHQHLDIGRFTVTEWIIHSLCVRENRRQAIPETLPAKRQLEVLREIAVFIAKGDKVSSDTLRSTLGVIANIKGLELDDLVGTSDGKHRGKLKDHPIIAYIGKEDSWIFKQDQVFFVLLAQTLFELAEQDTRSVELNTFVIALRSSASLQANIATALVEQIFEINTAPEIRLKLKRVISAILGCIDFDLAGDSSSQPAASLACTIATLANNREFPTGSSKREKTLGFIELLPMASINGLTFTGAISRFDLTNIVFTKCRFDQVTWIACDFDKSTEFRLCAFFGGSILSCNGFGLAQWSKDCLYDVEAMSFIDGEKIRAGSKTYSRDDLRVDMTLFIEKFIAKGGMVFRRQAERNLIRGSFGFSLHRDEIIKAGKRYLIQEHNSTALKENLTYEVRSDAKDSLVHFSENGIFTGPIKLMYNELAQDLRI